MYRVRDRYASVCVCVCVCVAIRGCVRPICSLKPCSRCVHVPDPDLFEGLTGWAMVVGQKRNAQPQRNPAQVKQLYSFEDVNGEYKVT